MHQELEKLRIFHNARSAVAVAAIAAWLAAGRVHAEYPGYDVTPTITEYDVDPNWPQPTDKVSSVGWVSGLAVDDKDQVWLFKKGPDPVHVYSADGALVRTWGQGLFNQPHQLRIDGEGNIWVADFGLHVVQKFTPEGKLLHTLGVRGEAGEDETHFNMPTNMAITPAGDVFVTDGYGNRGVVHFDKDGKYVNSWGGSGSERDSSWCPMPLSWGTTASSTWPTAIAAGSRYSTNRESFSTSGRN